MSKYTSKQSSGSGCIMTSSMDVRLTLQLETGAAVAAIAGATVGRIAGAVVKTAAGPGVGENVEFVGL
jgi:hypothetical protein